MKKIITACLLAGTLLLGNAATVAAVTPATEDTPQAGRYQVISDDTAAEITFDGAYLEHDEFGKVYYSLDFTQSPNKLTMLDTATGKVTAANAGHEYPVLMPAGDKFALVKDRHGFVIGGMEGVRYKEYELTLTPGSRLFVYTDGVPEATNAQNEMFGTERMLDALNLDPAAAPKTILQNVKDAVDSFVLDAEQFDDMTMLCVEYRGKNPGAGA